MVFDTGEFEKNLSGFAFEHLDVGGYDTELVDTFAQGLCGGSFNHVVDGVGNLSYGCGVVIGFDSRPEDHGKVGVGADFAVFGDEGLDIVFVAVGGVFEIAVGIGDCFFEKRVVLGGGELTHHVGHVDLEGYVHTAFEVETEVYTPFANFVEGVAEIDFLFADRVHVLFVRVVVGFVGIGCIFRGVFGIFLGLGFVV